MIEPLVARRVQLIGLDVDGVLTDGGLFVCSVGGERVEFKRFDAQDIVGVKLLKLAGLKIVLVSGRKSDATNLHAVELGVDETIQDDRKLPSFEGILLRFDVRVEDSAYVGYEIADIPLLRKVGLAAVVSNAAPEVKALARHTTVAQGGHGAVREFAETLLRARGSWDDTVQQYLGDRGDTASRASRNIRAPGVV
jgi:3-deoxy-D-manno-octulosonate 8-phosphate phosphatase (KDO 8-P phosphatase)